ncbi:hypothetical protein CH063_02919 [Colletotrichum higginsianum]|uniref:Subtilase n=1 Tax=Colletotrichum higginsianum (strain IMI 349063) TaxID=759273 RepID=H1VRB1_COLHI|nr:Subtilase [Colletotrichum higginsianum IMI 349063]OBR08260.1 Subtilase [Colletotrichum higginsianum IMI 349063]CCF42767.1 hypothetical protein CH063_02919 [Colletotrichum higginsianum]
MRIALVLQWLTAISSCHVITDRTSHSPVEVDKRTLNSVQIAGGRGNWACGAEELNKLQDFIDNAQQLARNAANALGVGGSENSAAYLKWFGQANANARTRIAIKTNNYESVITDLRFPDGTFIFSRQKLDPKGLSFVCWPQSDRHCQMGYIAGVMPAGYHPGFNTVFKGPILAMCPRFFNLPSQDEVVKALTQESPTLMLTAGLTLLHEMQHVNLTTGDERLCDDQIEMSKTHGQGFGCYDIKCTTSIPDEAKIKNAQNYAFFALDVTAFPHRGKQTDEGKSCVVGGLGKRVLVEAPGNHKRARRSVDGMFRFNNDTMKPSSWVSSTLRSSSLARSSSSQQQSSSMLPSSTLHPAPRPSSTQTPAPTATPEVVHVSDGETVTAVVGAVVVAGVGGGLVLVPSGALLPIPAGSTAVVSASTAANGAQEYELEEQKDDNNVPTPSASLSRPASETPTSSADLCSLAPGSTLGPEPATPDAPGFTFRDFLLLPGPEPTAFSTMSEPPTTANTTTSALPASTTHGSGVVVSSITRPDTSATVAPVACYNFDVNTYGYCCPGPGNPCENDRGDCYFDGESVSGGSTGVVPDGARCPPPPGAQLCRGPCEQ